MAIQQKKAGGKKLRRCTRRSPSEARSYAKAIGRPRKKRSDTNKGNYTVLRYEPYMKRVETGNVDQDGNPIYVSTLHFNVKRVKARELKK